MSDGELAEEVPGINKVTKVLLPAGPSSFPFPPRVMYNLYDDSDEVIAVNLLPLLANDIQSKGDQMSQTKTAKRSVTAPPPLSVQSPRQSRVSHPIPRQQEGVSSVFVSIVPFAADV